MNYGELKRMLRKAGCHQIKDHSRRKHEKWHSPATGEYFPVSKNNSKQVAPGTLDDILKKAGLK